MPRPHIEGLQYESVTPEDADTSGFLNVTWRVLSRDERDAAAYSVVADFEPDARCEPMTDRSIDLLVLEGRLVVDDVELGAGHYAFLPGGQARKEIRANARCRAFIAFGEGAPDNGVPTVLDPTTLPWQVKIYENVPEATGGRTILTYRILRHDEPNGVTTFLSAMWPDANQNCSEHHEPVDEGFVLRGDMLVLGPEREPVKLTGGSYYWRPSHARHLPKFSLNGCIRFVRTIGPLGLDTNCVHFPEPDWDEVVAAYRSEGLGKTRP